jgi:hypothetical protein
MAADTPRTTNKLVDSKGAMVLLQPKHLSVAYQRAFGLELTPGDRVMCNISVDPNTSVEEHTDDAFEENGGVAEDSKATTDQQRLRPTRDCSKPQIFVAEPAGVKGNTDCFTQMRHESTAENGKDGDDAGGKGEADAEDEEEENVSNDDDEDDDGEEEEEEEEEENWVTGVVVSLECRREPHYKVLLDKADTRVPLPLHTPAHPTHFGYCWVDEQGFIYAKKGWRICKLPKHMQADFEPESDTKNWEEKEKKTKTEKRQAQRRVHCAKCGIAGMTAPSKGSFFECCGCEETAWYCSHRCQRWDWCNHKDSHKPQYENIVIVPNPQKDERDEESGGDEDRGERSAKSPSLSPLGKRCEAVLAMGQSDPGSWVRHAYWSLPRVPTVPYSARHTLNAIVRLGLSGMLAHLVEHQHNYLCPITPAGSASVENMRRLKAFCASHKKSEWMLAPHLHSTIMQYPRGMSLDLLQSVRGMLGVAPDLVDRIDEAKEKKGKWQQLHPECMERLSLLEEGVELGSAEVLRFFRERDGEGKLRHDPRRFWKLETHGDGYDAVPEETKKKKTKTAGAGAGACAGMQEGSGSESGSDSDSSTYEDEYDREERQKTPLHRCVDELIRSKNVDEFSGYGHMGMGGEGEENLPAGVQTNRAIGGLLMGVYGEAPRPRELYPPFVQVGLSSKTILDLDHNHPRDRYFGCLSSRGLRSSAFVLATRLDHHAMMAEMVRLAQAQAQAQAQETKGHTKDTAQGRNRVVVVESAKKEIAQVAEAECGANSDNKAEAEADVGVPVCAPLHLDLHHEGNAFKALSNAVENNQVESLKCLLGPAEQGGCGLQLCLPPDKNTGTHTDTDMDTANGQGGAVAEVPAPTTPERRGGSFLIPEPYDSDDEYDEYASLFGQGPRKRVPSQAGRFRKWMHRMFRQVVCNLSDRMYEPKWLGVEYDPYE